MISLYAGLVGLISVFVFFVIRTLAKGHKPSWFYGKVSADLHQLGLDVNKLPANFRQHLFIESNAYYGATTNMGAHYIVAIRFFSWFVCESKTPSYDAVKPGSVEHAVEQFQRWARIYPKCKPIADKEGGRVLRWLYDGYEMITGDKAPALHAQLVVLELAKKYDLDLNPA